MRFPAYKERKQKIRKFISSNKLFILISIIVIILLFGNFFFKKEKTNDSIGSVVESSQINDEINTEETEEIESEPLQFRFYWIDLWILLIGGGFCVVMIIRQRKKSKEELQ